MFINKTIGNYLINWAEAPRITRDFAMLDSKGRRVGGRVVLLAAECVEIEGRWNMKYLQHLQVGIVYGYDPSAMRDGKRFGSSHETKWFNTRAERDAAVERYFANAAKRATRNSKNTPVEPLAPVAPAPAPAPAPTAPLAERIMHHANTDANPITSADAAFFNATPKQVRAVCQRLVRAGTLARVGRGQYAAA